MKAVILNNEFRVYWKGRLSFLQPFLAKKGIDFFAIELFGEGSPYAFDSLNTSESWWTCLFPQNKASDIAEKEIERVLFAELDRIKPDIVIASPITFYAGALGIRWAKKNKAKFIMFDDVTPEQVKRNVIVQTVKDLIIGQADALWFPSEDYYNSYSMFNNKGIHFFYGLNCIDNDLFRYNGIKQFDHNILISVARLVPLKNFGNLLAAWKKVESAGLDTKLVIIGDGQDFDDLIAKKSELGLMNVEFLGIINNTKIPEYYFKADAFILASLYESWGLVVNEAMAAGLPVLLSNKINAKGKLLDENKNGFSFDPLDVDEMAAAIIKFINMPTEAKEKMSKRSLQIIESMSYENMGINLYNAMITIHAQKNKNALLPSLLIKIWNGRYNNTGWYKV